MINENLTILDRLTKLEHRVDQLENLDLVPSLKLAPVAMVTKQQSLREFLNEKNPQTANDRGLAIAYYMETIKRLDSFNADDLKMGFREARIPVPKNPNDVINKNIIKGYMMDAEQGKEGKKAWVLTASGIVIVEKGFGEDA